MGDDLIDALHEMAKRSAALSNAASRILSDAATIARLTAALAASEARVAEMESALRAVRKPVEQHRNELLRDFTTAGSMDRSTMDEDEAEWVAEWDAALARIDAALAPAAPHASDCAMHDAPAMRAGDCDCGAQADAGTDEGEGGPPLPAECISADCSIILGRGERCPVCGGEQPR